MYDRINRAQVAKASIPSDAVDRARDVLTQLTGFGSSDSMELMALLTQPHVKVRRHNFYYGVRRILTLANALQLVHLPGDFEIILKRSWQLCDLEASLKVFMATHFYTVSVIFSE